MRKVADLPDHELQHACLHPQHNPPTMVVLPPGVYEHECPACHATLRVVVRNGPSLGTHEVARCRYCMSIAMASFPKNVCKRCAEERGFLGERMEGTPESTRRAEEDRLNREVRDIWGPTKDDER